VAHPFALFLAKGWESMNPKEQNQAVIDPRHSQDRVSGHDSASEYAAVLSSSIWQSNNLG
jgi:hypothetical protein